MTRLDGKRIEKSINPAPNSRCLRRLTISGIIATMKRLRWENLPSCDLEPWSWASTSDPGEESRPTVDKLWLYHLCKEHASFHDLMISNNRDGRFRNKPLVHTFTRVQMSCYHDFRDAWAPLSIWVWCCPRTENNIHSTFWRVVYRR